MATENGMKVQNNNINSTDITMNICYSCYTKVYRSSNKKNITVATPEYGACKH
jgi:hypothetical protein